MGFFQGFNLDTLLAIISCATGIIALFLGGKHIKTAKSAKTLLNKIRNMTMVVQTIQ